MAIKTSFLDIYVEKYNLSDITEVVRRHLADLEKALDHMSKFAVDSKKFDEVVQLHAAEIFDLIDRVTQHVKNWKDWSFKSVLSSLKFVINIANEISQITNDLYSKVAATDGTLATKLAFGQNLVSFVWFAIDPLKNKFTWIPFKKSIERSAVKYVAKIGLQAAFDMFDVKDATVKTMSVDKPTGTVKCLKALA